MTTPRTSRCASATSRRPSSRSVSTCSGPRTRTQATRPGPAREAVAHRPVALHVEGARPRPAAGSAAGSRSASPSSRACGSWRADRAHQRPPSVSGSTSCGVAITWSARSGRTAVPIAKNSVVWPPQRCGVRQQLHADDALGVQRLGLGLHPAHRELAGVVERLGELRRSRRSARCCCIACQKPLVGDVVDAGAHHHAQRRVAGLDERPEVLPGQVGGERLVAVVAPGAAVRASGVARRP